MSGLILKLGPRERVMINGVVIENGDRRTRLSVVTPDAKILRLKDAIHPSEATTPVTRVCYIAQLLISGEVDANQAKRDLQVGIGQLTQVFQDHYSQEVLDTAKVELSRENYYHTLKALRRLIDVEAQLMALSAAE
ncbi:MAG: flagellar biosynthesis repressor FlbT [Pseudomonadota bacterium]